MLIGLSTAVPTAPFLATGHLGREQIVMLAAALERYGREGLFRVVMVHHPPISKPARHFKRASSTGASFAPSWRGKGRSSSFTGTTMCTR